MARASEKEPAEEADSAVHQLSFKMTPIVDTKLDYLRQRVRDAGHARPTRKTLVQALIKRPRKTATS